MFVTNKLKLNKRNLLIKKSNESRHNFRSRVLLELQGSPLEHSSRRVKVPGIFQEGCFLHHREDSKRYGHEKSNP